MKFFILLFVVEDDMCNVAIAVGMGVDKAVGIAAMLVYDASATFLQIPTVESGSCFFFLYLSHTNATPNYHIILYQKQPSTIYMNKLNVLLLNQWHVVRVAMKVPCSTA